MRGQPNPGRGGDGRRRLWSESPIARVGVRKVRAAGVPIVEVAAAGVAASPLDGIHNDIQFPTIGAGEGTFTLRMVLAVGMDAYTGTTGSNGGAAFTSFGVYRIPWTEEPIGTESPDPTPVLLATVTGGPWTTLDEVTTTVTLDTADALAGYWYLGLTLGIGIYYGDNPEAYLST